MAQRILLTILLLSLLASRADARKWISRDGKYSVEAELIDFKDGKVILKRDNGPVITVPLEKLGLADSKYVQEALSALGRNLSDELPGAKKPVVKKADPSADAPANGTDMPESATSDSEVKKALDGEPPLTLDNGKWQVRPDAPSDPIGIPTGHKLSIDVNDQDGRMTFSYPRSPSPFVAGRCSSSPGQDGPIKIFDLRTGESVGKIYGKRFHHESALSPDGRHFAEATSSGKVNLWSFKSGKMVHEINPGGAYSSIRMLEFAGPNRLMIFTMGSGALTVWDVNTGKQLSMIKIGNRLETDKFAVSPGGCYLAIAPHTGFKIFDTRNGVLAGEFSSGSGNRSEEANGIAFSHDGSELAAIVSYASKKNLVCWEMKQGTVTTKFNMEKTPFVTSSSRSLQWFADKSAWWINRNSVLDRKLQKIIYKIPKDTARTKDPRRLYIDANRVLMVMGDDRKDQALKIVPIDKELLASAKKVIASGGTTDDVGLPPLTDAKFPSDIESPVATGDWTYKPKPAPLSGQVDLSKSIVLSKSSYNYRSAFFAIPSEARVVIEARGDSSTKPPSYVTYDLKTGRQTGQFKTPFPTEFIGVGPLGKLGVFRIGMTKDRLDIFDFEENKPVLAFRPYASQPEYRQDVTWAALVANNMLITLNEDGYLIAWDLPSCKPKWSMEIVKLLVPGLDASRTTLAVGSLDGVHIVDVATGEVRGSLERVLERPRVRLRELVFRGDGEALVSRYVEISENLRTSKTTICSWDLMDGSLKREIQLNCESNSIGWVGPDQVLLRRTSSGDRSTNITRQDFSKFYQCSLVDLKRGFLTWTYQHPHGKTIDQAFVDRHWCIVSSSISQAGHLMAITLPDPEAAKLLETAKPPRALLKKNDQVSLSVEVVGDFPVSSDDQKNRAISLRDEVHKKIIDALAAIRITHNEQAPTRLNVSLSERKLSRKVTVRPRLRPYGTRVLLLTTTYVEISFNLVSSGNTIWRASQHVSINDIESNKLGKAPAGSDSGLFYRRLLWETALKKVANFDLPLPIYSTEVAEGLGESNLSPSGGKATRKPRVSQDKQT